MRLALLDAKLALVYRRFDHDPTWEAHFRGNPLDTDVPVPPWLFLDQCVCDPACYHGVDCPDFPVFALLSAQIGDPRGIWMWPQNTWSQLLWVCQEEEEWFHTGGEINGPDHWCERRRAFVTYRDSKYVAIGLDGSRRSTKPLTAWQ